MHQSSGKYSETIKKPLWHTHTMLWEKGWWGEMLQFLYNYKLWSNLICSIFKSTQMRKHVEIEAMLNSNAMLNLICSIYKSTWIRKHVEIEAMLNLNGMLNLICSIYKSTSMRKHACWNWSNANAKSKRYAEFDMYNFESYLKTETCWIYNNINIGGYLTPYTYTCMWWLNWSDG